MYLIWVVARFATVPVAEAVVRRCSVKKVFLEISHNSQENTSARFSFLISYRAKKETLAQVFSYEFCENSKNTFYYRTSLVAASAVGIIYRGSQLRESLIH